MRIAAALFFYLLCFSLAADAAILRGTVSDTSGRPIPYASVFLNNSHYGVTCDAEGTYFLELAPGSYAINFSALGFEKHLELVKLTHAQTLFLNVKLQKSVTHLNEVEVSAVYEDRGKAIMRLVRKKGDEFNSAVETYSCSTYQKISVERITHAPDSTKKNDTLSARKKRKAEKQRLKEEKKKLEEQDTTSKHRKKKKDKGSISDKGYEEYQKLQNLKLIESAEIIYFRRPGKYKVLVNAYHDFSDVRAGRFGNTVSLGFEYGEYDISDVGFNYDDPYLIYFNPTETDFNFYRNQLDAPLLCDKPLLSPFASTAELSYRFSLDTSYYDGDIKVYRILVNPIFKGEALFSGAVYVEDSTWVVRSIDFAINPSSLLFCEEFRINQDYREIKPGIYLPVRREYTYTIKDNDATFKGNTRVDHSAYVINETFPPKFFTNEVKSYDIYAFDRDSNWWNALRPITLKTTELAYIEKSDSVRDFLESDEYLDSLDAESNKINFWSFIIHGVGHRNHRTGIEYWIAPLAAQPRPFGIGGYRHAIFGTFQKEFKTNNYLLEIDPSIDYGFKNKDLKGQLGVGLTYFPKKFVRTRIDAGDYYDVINTYPSLGTLFARANYVRVRTFSIAQRIELINGLFAEFTFDYAGMDPLTNLQLDRWTKIVYADLNKPTDFVAYKKTEIRIDLKYRFKQKYIIKKNKKIILGSKYPEASLLYRKGLKDVLKSEVDFDYLEGGLKQELQLGRYGYGSWSALGGWFANIRSLRVIEYKYFRGSDEGIFSNPLTSFQLLGPTLSASRSYLRFNGIFHDQGFIFNKIPGFSKFRLGLAAGAGYLAIPEQNNFRHAEMFAGIEWTFRIRKELFRVGLYAVTAENTISVPNLTYKVGLSTFSNFRKRWSY